MAIPPYDPSEFRAPPHPLAARRSGAGKYIALLSIVILLGVGWTGLWFYAAGVAEDTVAGWRTREAQAGRLHSCGSQQVGGFPFRIELNCERADSEWRSLTPALQIRTAEIHAAAQIYQPTLLIAEIAGPMTLGETGQPPYLMANWSLAQSSLRGTPSAPERVSIVLDQPVFSRLGGGAPLPLAQANRMEFHGRIAEGSARDNPVIETVLRMSGASLPGLHELAVAPMNTETTAVLRGLKDFSPKPWAARFREIQAANGSIDITQARIEQGESLAVGSGTLNLNANGRLEGQLRLTVVGLDVFLKKIGFENTAPVDRLAGTLDRFMPGLGAIARSQAGAGVVAGINLIGEQTTLEGHKAVAVPLRFVDGAMLLGPLQLGQIPPLF
jgi:hypothetical protein